MILRDVNDESGRRTLSAVLTTEGDLQIEGQDLGPGVEHALGAGIREYEWVWTVRAANIPALLTVLGSAGPLLSVLRERFSDENAALLKRFLDEHKILHEVWSRYGD